MVHSKVVLVDPVRRPPDGDDGLPQPWTEGERHERRKPADHSRRARPGGGLRDQHHGDLQPVPLAIPPQAHPSRKRWKGLRTETWQKGYLKPGSGALREIDFWVGE